MKKKWNTLFRRLRSKKVIVAIISCVLVILTNTGVIDLNLAKRIGDITTSILSILVELGII
jgi:uncharacterized membrane protein